MMNKKGFTLTEILLAVMIVGIIGVALASLTTAASRESGIGRSKVMMRNNLSLFMRMMRLDVQNTTRVLYKSGEVSGGTSQVPLLALGQNVDLRGQQVGDNAPTVVLYCFQPGSITKTTSGATVVPSGSKDGGSIYRYEVPYASYSVSVGEPNCPSSGGEEILSNVKYIPSSSEYPVPYIGPRYIPTVSNSVRRDLGSVIYVNIITELPSNPVVNDVIPEDLVVRNGFSMN